MKILAALPLIALLCGPVAFAQTASAPNEIDAQSVEGLQFTEQETRIIRQQIQAAQARANKAETSDQTPPQSLKDIELPTKAEIAEMQKQLPDLNAMLSDMMELAQGEDFQTDMRKSVDRMKSQFEGTDLEMENGMPDLNAMMGAMLMMFAEDEIMDTMLSQIVPMAEMMEKHVPESTTPSND